MSRASQYQVTKQPESSQDNNYPYELATIASNTTPKSNDQDHPSRTWNTTNCCDGLAEGCCCCCFWMNCDSNSDGCDCCSCDGCDCNGCDCGGCDGCDCSGCDCSGCDCSGCDLGGCNC